MPHSQPLQDPASPVAIAVVGGGPAGLAAALALLTGLGPGESRVALITPAAPPAGTGAEARTAALFTPALRLLERLVVWDAVRPAAAPMAGLRIVDQTPALLRAPEVLFEAAEIGQATFGYNVPNGPLMAALRARAAAVAADPAGGLVWHRDTSVVAVEPGPDAVVLRLSSGERLAARLVVAADGRQSLCRSAAGIGARVRETGQVAITTTFGHSESHRDISTEFHRPSGPLTTVPLPADADGGHRSALVWMERPAVAERLLALDDAAFCDSLSAQLQGLLGQVGLPTPRGRFDLAYVRADRLAARRVLLVGETAHAMPPIGAQGLNLSFRDVVAMAETVTAALASGRDPGGDDVLARYSAAREADLGLRMGAVEALNGSLLMDMGAVNMVRGAGLHVVRAVGPLRRELMRRGLGA